MLKSLKPLTANALILIVTVFLIATGNAAFYGQLTDAFPLHGLNIAFVLSVSVVLGAATALLLALVSNRYLLKPALITALLVAAVCAYFSDTFGTVIDVSMLVNAAETDRAEARDLFSLGLVLRVLLLGIMPAVLVWRWPVARSSWRTELLARLKLVGLALLAVVLVSLPLSAHYSSFIREYKQVRYFSNPLFPIYSGIRFLGGEAKDGGKQPLQKIGLDAKIPADDKGRELMILVVGETARADHFSLYGYNRPTNPELSKIKNLVVYRDVQSCGTSTAVSVPCMFSKDGRADFNLKRAAHTENVLDVLKRAGVSVFWLDNNSSSKGVADRVSYTDYKTADNNPDCDDECRDTGMLKGLKERIDGAKGDVLIILHQMGSHGPAYYKRYPKQFERFTPVCRSNNLSDCGKQEIINAYDNSILYTDHFLAETVKLLQHYEPDFETMMLYVSDHGESLGENGMYLHGAPYLFAPREQTTVPLLIWQGSVNDVDEPSLAVNAKQPQSHDMIFQSLLNFYEIESDLTLRNEGLFSVDDRH